MSGMAVLGLDAGSGALTSTTTIVAGTYSGISNPELVPSLVSRANTSGWIVYSAPMMRVCGAVLLMLAANGCSAPNTAAPPGVIERFDASAGFTAMANFAGPQARLITLRATGVGSDGMMNLAAPGGPKIAAEFVAAAIAGDPELQPEGKYAVGHAIRVLLTVQAPRGEHRGMGRAPNGRATGDERTIEPPGCTFVELWNQAIELGAPRTGTATIDYDAEGYAFAIDGQEVRRFSGSCAPTKAGKPKKKK